MTNRVLRGLFYHTATVYRSKKTIENGISNICYEMLERNIPCRVAQSGTAKANLKKISLCDIAKVSTDAKLFVEHTVDIKSGDMVEILMGDSEIGEFFVGEIFLYRNSHKECRLSRDVEV